MVGKVLEKLDETGFSNDTLVVMFGDHGWQLVSDTAQVCGGL